MKFKFCGGDDCPSWVLMQINCLSMLTKDIFTTMCTDVIKDLLGNPLDFNKFEGLMDSCERVPKLDRSIDMRACIAGLTNIVRNAAVNDVPPPQLEAEIIQLGLTPEFAPSLTVPYTENLDELKCACNSSRIIRSPKSIAFESIEGEVFCLLTFNTEGGDHNVVIRMTPKQAHDVAMDPELMFFLDKIPNSVDPGNL